MELINLKKQILFPLKINRKTINKIEVDLELFKECLSIPIDISIVYMDNENGRELYEYPGRADKCEAYLKLAFNEEQLKRYLKRNAGVHSKTILYTNDNDEKEVLTIGKYIELSKTMYDYEIIKKTNIKNSQFVARKALVVKMLKSYPLEEVENLKF